jgi:SNF2 family DNA or RNA helicase
MEEIVTQCKIRKTHFCFLFIDKSSTKSLPSPEFLAMFSIVITTNQRFTNEWKNGSFQEELKRNDNSRNTNYRVDLTFWDLDEQSASSLLKVNWLRLIVDEGHSMGRGKDNSAISFASWIHAERRWAMTGTPTRQTLSQTGLSSILNLLQYLQHSFFERKKDGDTVWQTLITRGWNRGHLSSFYRVQNLLSLLMVRHTKMDIEELPLPTYKTTILPMSGDEVTTYNTLVCAIQSNLIITAMQGKTSGKQDSLLHKTQAKHAKKALVNVRLVCAGGTQVLPTLSQQFWEEFIHDFKICNHNAHSVSKVRRYLKRATTGKLSSCDCCGIALSTLLVFPCGDLVCTECTSPQNHVCVVCQKPFDVDLFQRLQPGMDYQWLHNVEEEKSALKNKQGLLSRDSDTPVDAGIGQVLLLQGGAGMMAPVNPQQQERHRRTKKPGDGHVCEFCPKLANGECRLCLKEHDDCNFMSDGHTCPVCFKRAEECPESETKSAHVVSKLLDLHQNFETYQLQQALQSPLKSTEISHEKRPLKVIVFSQFRKVLNMTGDRLLRRFGSAAVAEYWGSFRRKELHKFIYSKECVCMLLGKDGSEGLDLSFVTHM